jgi:predicted permease
MMELDDLKTTWKKEVNMTTQTVDFKSIKSEVGKLDKHAKMSWSIEAIGALFGIFATVIFTWVWLDSPIIFTQVVAVILILSLVYSARLFFGIQQAETQDDWTLLAKINIQIEKREKEVKMLRNLAVMQLIPMFSIMTLASYAIYIELTGMIMPSMTLMIGWVAGLVYFIFLHFHNRSHLNNKFLPALEQLYKLKKQLND